MSRIFGTVGPAAFAPVVDGVLHCSVTPEPQRVCCGSE